MTPAERSKLFDMTYMLDNLPRVYVPKDSKPYRAVSCNERDKLRMQEKTERLYVLISEEDLLRWAEEIRECVANDEDRVYRRQA